jgi:hypothetical protein
MAGRSGGGGGGSRGGGGGGGGASRGGGGAAARPAATHTPSFSTPRQTVNTQRAVSPQMAGDNPSDPGLNFVR